MKEYEEKIAELKQLYSVKKVLFFRGHDGYGFNASLYMRKKKIAFIIDLAQGSDFQIEEDDYEAVEKLKLACKNIGLVPAVYNDGVKKIPVKYPYTIDSLVEDLLEDYENRKKLKKKISK